MPSKETPENVKNLSVEKAMALMSDKTTVLMSASGEILNQLGNKEKNRKERREKLSRGDRIFDKLVELVLRRFASLFEQLYKKDKPKST